MELRGYQKPIVMQALNALDAHRRVVVACPTGSGKTVIAMEGIIPALPGRVAWVTHRRELAKQAAEYGRGIDVFMAQSGISGEYDVIIIDEGHHVCAAQYRRIIDAYPLAKIIALTATPYRMDGVGLGSCGFSKIIHGPDAYDLTVEGVLCRVRVYIPKSESIAAWQPAAAAGRICKTEFRKGIAFCRSVKEAKQLADLLNSEGVRAECIDGATVAAERESMFAAFAGGEIKVMCNHTVFTEGVDVPAVDLVVLNRATMSRCLWKQMIGRGTRKAPGKAGCTVLDLAGNGVVHGSIYDREIYDLSGKVESTEGRAFNESLPPELAANYQHNQGEELKEWKPQPKPIRVIESLLKLKSPLQRLRSRTA